MKPRASPRSVPKSAPDRQSGGRSHAAIPAWAEKTPTRLEKGRSIHARGTSFLKMNLTRSGTQDRLAVTQQLRGASEPLLALHPALASIRGDSRQNSEPPGISTKPIHGASEPFLTVKVAAHVLAVSEKTVRRLINRGDLAAIRIGRSVRIRPEVLAAYIDGRVA